MLKHTVSHIHWMKVKKVTNVKQCFVQCLLFPFHYRLACCSHAVMRAFAFAPCRDHKSARERSAEPSLSENNAQAARGRRERVRMNYLSP